MPFILKHPKAVTETPIMMSYHFDGRRLKFSTGQAIHPKDWNPTSHRPRRSYGDYLNMTRLLDGIEERTRKMYLNLKAEFIEITPETLRLAIIRDLKLEGKKETLVMFFERYLEEKPMTKGVKQNYRNALLLIKAYPKSKDFADITPTWFERFCAYMSEKGYKPNTQGVVINNIRSVITAAKKQGLHHNEAYKDFSAPKEDADTVYLSVDELMSMHRLELSGTLAKVRDRFLIGAFTGLRFSDNQKLTIDSIRNGLLFDKNKKTGTSVVIPVHWVVEEIMGKYPEGLPGVVSKVWSNKKIRVIGEKAGIKVKIMHQGTLNEKYNLIASHTARRSFATNAFLAGIPPLSIMLITGHKTESAFRKYIRISTEQNARLIAGHEFFVKPPDKG